MSSKFGFTVERRKDGFVVFLPHQCDKWDIAGDAMTAAHGGVPHTEAVTELRRFIAEAESALARLSMMQHG